MGMSAVFNAVRIGLPSPPPAMMATIPTIDSDSSRVWLSPAMIAGRASGICTSRRIRVSVAPNARAASTTSEGTWRIPRLVSRTMGGSAKTSVASTPGVRRTPNRKMMGSRYTKGWITCMPSRTGRSRLQNASTRAASIPRGMPITVQISTATMIIPSVSMVRSQYSLPSSPQISRPTALPSPTRKFLVAKPSRKNSSSTTGHGSQSCRKLSMMSSSSLSTGHLTASRNPLIWVVSQKTISSIHRPNGISQASRLSLSQKPVASIR